MNSNTESQNVNQQVVTVLSKNEHVGEEEIQLQLAEAGALTQETSATVGEALASSEELSQSIGDLATSPAEGQPLLGQEEVQGPSATYPVTNATEQERQLQTQHSVTDNIEDYSAVQFYVTYRGYTLEEAIAKVKMQHQEKNGSHGSRAWLCANTKRACEYFWAEGKSIITAADANKYARDDGGYTSTCSKANGDAMGRHGLFMKPSSKKFDGRKAYDIPDPTLYPDWYQNDDEMLPDSYYGSYLAELEAIESRNPKSPYFAKRSEYMRRQKQSK